MPFKYEPKRTNTFVLEFDGIDLPSFTVKKIKKYPTFKKKLFSFKEHELKCVDNLIVEFYSPIAPSVMQSLFVSIGESFSIIEKDLDPVGTVISKKIYKNCKIKNFIISEKDYENKDLETITVTFSIKQVQLEY